MKIVLVCLIDVKQEKYIGCSESKTKAAEQNDDADEDDDVDNGDNDDGDDVDWVRDILGLV